MAALPKKKPVFIKALRGARPLGIIAEIKKKSPSKGILRRNFDPKEIARQYQRAGARAISVLTDQKFFGGSADILKSVRAVTRLPILRKDFIVDEYQIYESRLLGADAVLLIAAILSTAQIKSFGALAQRLGLDCLYEALTKQDIKKILKAGPRMIGINNRDLRTFSVDIRTTAKLVKGLSRKFLLVSESGIKDHDDLLYLRNLGIKAALVGETLMKEKRVDAALQNLLGTFRG